MNRKKPEEDQSRIRCAIYTRKSTEERLDLEFNSLDAQRDAAESFMASQKSEGWVCLPKRYDDGGFSGGNLDRPAYNELMKDIEAGEVDCVIVYKVDRLGRSLFDFAQTMKAFDASGVSFVSVTQQFNTTNSMGRLTLNILLSFAQFEREIISERISDKIAAQRQKGLWCGGQQVLGYDVDHSSTSPKLVVNAQEAEMVREIFESYLSLQSLLPVVQKLDQLGWTNKTWLTRKGRYKGWMRQYNIVDGKPMPFNSKPDAAYRVCMQRTCTQLVNGCLAKCPALAYWAQLETKARLESISEWDLFRSYEACPPTASDDELRSFLETKSIPQCALCPSRRVAFRHPIPLQRSNLQ